MLIPSLLGIMSYPKFEKCIEQWGYRCYNPTIGELRVTREVVWDEMIGSYIGGNNEQKVTQRMDHQSQTLSGPRDLPSHGSRKSMDW